MNVAGGALEAGRPPHGRRPRAQVPVPALRPPGAAGAGAQRGPGPGGGEHHHRNEHTLQK